MSSASSNKRFVLASVPKGEPDEKTFKLEDAPAPEVKDGQLLVKALWITVDPYLRGALPSIGAGKPMVSGQVAEVVESKSADYKKGDKVVFYGVWALQQAIDPKSKDAKLRKVDESVPLSLYLGILGMPGATAYLGLFEAGQFKKGDVVLVSGAAGAVGSLVGQLAKLHGAKLVIGTAGGPEKCALVTGKFGFDAAIDYKKFDTVEKVTAELKRISPEGVDLYFDNTGGHVTDAFYTVVKKFGRSAVCGSISVYNKDPSEVKVPSPFIRIIYTSVTIKGFIVYDYEDKWPQFEKEVTQLVKENKVQHEETVVEGFEKLPEAFSGLFHGKNTGKMIVKIA